MNAPANPAPAPANTIPIPVKESKPSAIANVTMIGIKGNVSSAIPNTAPPNENKITIIGIIALSLPFILSVTLPMPASIAPVASTTAKAPPTINIKNMIDAVSTMPSGTDLKKSMSPVGVFSINSNDVGSTTILPLALSIIAYCPAGTM